MGRSDGTFFLFLNDDAVGESWIKVNKRCYQGTQVITTRLVGAWLTGDPQDAALSLVFFWFC